MTVEKITNLTMTTYQPKLQPICRESYLGKDIDRYTKCQGTTKKGNPCNSISTMATHCDLQYFCKKHVKQVKKIEPTLSSIKELPNIVLKLLPYELWLDIFEIIPKPKECKFLSPTEDYKNYQCKSCERVYKIL